MPCSLRRRCAVVPFVALAAALSGQQQIERRVGLGGGRTRAAFAEPPPVEPVVLQPTFDALAKRLGTMDDDRRDVADAAWHVLMLCAARETLRSGPHKNTIKTVAAWLRSVQDDAGRFAPNGEPCGRSAQLLAALAIATAQRDANYRLLLPTATKAMTAALAAARAEPELPCEEVVLVAMLLDPLRTLHGADSMPVATAMDVATRGLAGLPLGRSRRIDAAAHLTRLLLGDSPPPDLTVALCWPGNLRADPWHAVFGALAVRRLGDAACRAQWPLAQQILAARDEAGLWPAAPGLTQSTTTAMLAAALALVHVPEPKHDPADAAPERRK